MSYASVTAHNAPPISQQPHPDTALLNTTPPTASAVADDASKVNLVAPDFGENPQTVTSKATQPTGSSQVTRDDIQPTNHADKHTDTKRHVQQGEVRMNHLCGSVAEYFVRPGLAGGIIGLVNIGLIASVGRIFYLRPHLRRDVTAVTSALAATAAIFLVEGAAAKRVRQTPQGRDQEKKMKERSATFAHYIHEQVMRPSIGGGMIGFVNASILGAVGYFSYANWNKPWDRKVVSAVTLGLLTLWRGESYFVDHQLNGRH